MNSSLIIVGYNGRDWLQPLCESMSGTLEPADQLVVVDNGGNDGAIPTEFASAALQVLVTPRRMGFCDANNFALENLREKTELIGFVNQDVVVAPGWLDSIQSVFQANPSIGALSPIHLTYDFSRLNPNFRSAIRGEKRCISRRVNEQGWFPVDNLIAAAMVVRASVLEQVGGFDPVFGSYCEDYDLCQRIRAAGYQTGVVRASRIGHFDGSATRSKAAEFKRERQTVRNWTILRIRASRNRTAETIKQLGWALPKRLLGSLLRRPGSKHPASVLRAWLSLLMLLPRLISKSRDDRLTQSNFVRMRRNWAQLQAAESELHRV